MTPLDVCMRKTLLLTLHLRWIEQYAENALNRPKAPLKYERKILVDSYTDLALAVVQRECGVISENEYRTRFKNYRDEVYSYINKVSKIARALKKNNVYAIVT